MYLYFIQIWIPFFVNKFNRTVVFLSEFKGSMYYLQFSFLKDNHTNFKITLKQIMQKIPKILFYYIFRPYNPTIYGKRKGKQKLETCILEIYDFVFTYL